MIRYYQISTAMQNSKAKVRISYVRVKALSPAIGIEVRKRYAGRWYPLVLQCGRSDVDLRCCKYKKCKRAICHSHCDLIPPRNRPHTQEFIINLSNTFNSLLDSYRYLSHATSIHYLDI